MHRPNVRTSADTFASGDEGNRTPNPRLAKAVLCQLSYVPVCAARRSER